MTDKLKFAKNGLSPLEKVLMDAAEEIDSAQQKYDDALDKYVERRALIEFGALTDKEHFQDKDGQPRSAANDVERRSLQKLLVAQDRDLAPLRKEMQAARRVLKLWQSREKNARLILSARVEAE